MKKIFIISTIAVIAAGIIAGTLFTIRRNSQSNAPFNQSPEASTTLQPPANSGINDINYEPSKPSENAQSEETKNNTTKDPPTPTVNQGIVATVTRSQVSGIVAQIRVLVTGTSSGTCELTLSKSGSTNIVKSSPISTKEGGIVTCDGFDIPVAELTNGAWKVSITLKTASGNSPVAESVLQI